MLMGFFLFFLAGPARSHEQVQIYRISDGKTIAFEQMIGEVSNAEIIFTGELHNNERHHRLQLETVRGLSEAGLPVAIGLEMFPIGSQGTLDQWVAGSVPLDDFIPFYQKHWSQPWPLYRDIFLHARDNKIPLLALNIPPEISQKVRHSGFSSLTDEEIKQLPPGLVCNVDDKYMQFIRKAFALHKNDDKAFIHFCESQLLRDKSMAWYLLDHLRTHSGKKIVVITGITHAWKMGIPDQLRQLSGGDYRVLLPEVPGAVEPGNLTTGDADYIFLR